jgi:dihydroorotase-like cyclic amidohydrolase
VRGGRCLDVVAGEFRRVDVRIRDGRIDEIAADFPAGPGVRTLDVTGSTRRSSP